MARRKTNLKKGQRVHVVRAAPSGFGFEYEGPATVVRPLGINRAMVVFDLGETELSRDTPRQVERYIAPDAQSNPIAFVDAVNARIKETRR